MIKPKYFNAQLDILVVEITTKIRYTCTPVTMQLPTQKYWSQHSKVMCFSMVTASPIYFMSHATFLSHIQT